jgi:hypothetical protein
MRKLSAVSRHRLTGSGVVVVMLGGAEVAVAI